MFGPHLVYIIEGVYSQEYSLYARRVWRYYKWWTVVLIIVKSNTILCRHAAPTLRKVEFFMSIRRFTSFTIDNTEHRKEGFKCLYCLCLSICLFPPSFLPHFLPFLRLIWTEQTWTEDTKLFMTRVPMYVYSGLWKLIFLVSTSKTWRCFDVLSGNIISGTNGYSLLPCQKKSPMGRKLFPSALMPPHSSRIFFSAGCSVFLTNFYCFISRQNFIPLFAHSTFTVRSQNTIYSDYNWLSHHQQN